MKQHITTIIGLILIVGLVIVGAATWNLWSPSAKEFFSSLQTEKIDDHGHSHGPGGTHVHAPDDNAHGHSHGSDSHAHAHDDQHGHSHGAHETEPEKDTIELSTEARKNIGLETGTVRKGSYEKTVTVPAVVVERQSESRSSVVAHLAGIVSKVYLREGEKVAPGQPLFDLELRHDDAVSVQADFLNALGAADLAAREMNRLTSIGSGVIPKKRIIEQQYAIDKAKTMLDSIRQSLLLHHLSAEQIREIERGRHLLESITIVAPDYPDEAAMRDGENQYHVSAISVTRGEGVDHAQVLCVLSNFGRLYVEGQAFEGDVQQLLSASNSGKEVRVTPASGDNPEELSLKLLYVADEVDRESRALKFYLELPNQQNILDDNPSGNQFVAWKFRPGQRMEVQVPTASKIDSQIVLPPDAVAIDGPNAFVFLKRGEHFDRHEVHVLTRDRNAVVIELDKRLLGRRIAMSGAYQIHVAMKNASGAGADPHAGHSH